MPSLVFALAFVVILTILMHQSAGMSALQEQVKALIQELALARKEIRDMQRPDALRPRDAESLEPQSSLAGVDSQARPREECWPASTPSSADPAPGQSGATPSHAEGIDGYGG